MGHVALDARLARGVVAQRLAGGGELALAARASDELAFAPAGSLESLALLEAAADGAPAERAHWGVDVALDDGGEGAPPPPPARACYRVRIADATSPGAWAYADMASVDAGAGPAWPSGFALDNVTRCWDFDAAA